MAIKDMIEPSQASDVRQATLDFIRNLIYGQVLEKKNCDNISGRK